MTHSDSAPKGNGKTQMKSAARLYAVQALFQMEHSDLTFDKVIAEFENHRFGAVYEDGEMIQTFTGNTNPNNARVILLDANGIILSMYDGGFSVEVGTLTGDAGLQEREIDLAPLHPREG